MRAFWVLILLAIPGMAIAQSANFEDGFSDKDISNWLGDTGDFTFTEENGNVLLQQDADGAGSSSLSIVSGQVTGYWEFFIRMDFAPSASNKAEIYLMSDRPDLTGAVNGYKLTGGENGSDDVFRLFRVDGGAESEEIITGTTNISAGGDYRVRVSRTATGDWSLEIGQGYAGALSPNGAGTDNTYSSASHFGFTTTYTSTRANLFAFDFKIEIPPLTFSSVSLFDDSSIDVNFSRAIDHSSASSTNFTVNPGNISPSSVSDISASAARLSFPSAFEGGSYQLQISGIEDAANQSVLADTTVNFVVYDEPQPGDIIINEFMKDPPEGAAEYVELKNISSRFINLRDWEIGDNNSLTRISSTDQPILPGGFVVLSPDTSALSTLFGKANYIDLSLPALNNTSDQIRLYDSKSITADSLAYTPDWGGTEVALERRSASVSAIFRENWGESPSVNFGTPGFENQVLPDETPPEIIDLLVPDNQSLKLIFSERVDAISAGNSDNYQLTQQPEPGINPPPLPSISSAELLSANTLQLNLSRPLQEYSGTWLLEANNLADIFGNTTQEVISFDYFDVFEAEPGQVAINEFVYDPPPGFSEFIELYNHTDSSFNLQDWTLNDNTGTRHLIADSSLIIPRHSFIVLTPDSSLTELFPGLQLIDMGSRFPALNNTTDAIVIRNAESTVIDSITYFSSWGGQEVSLERRELTISGNYEENWDNSPADAYATPGMENQIAPDSEPPQLISLSKTAPNQIRLIFNERLQPTETRVFDNYQLTTDIPQGELPGIISIEWVPPDTVYLNFRSELPRRPEGSWYQLQIANQTDIFGNVAPLITDSLFIIDFALPARGKLFVTEFMYDPPEGFSEFIELYNASDSTLNLQGLTLNDNSSTRRTIMDTDFGLAPNSFVVLAPDSTLLTLFPDISLIPLGSRFASLNNTSDAIVLRNQQGMLLDSLTYTSDWGGQNVSLERRSITHNSNYKANWGNSASSAFATPGSPNAIEPDIEAPFVVSSQILGAETIEVIFSERIDSAQATLITNFVFSPVVEVASIDYKVDTLIINLTNAFEDGQSYQLTITNQQDIFGNTMDEAVTSYIFSRFSEAEENDLIINEMLYRRKRADAEEFVELYNRSDKNIDLSNWTLSDASSSVRIPSGTQLRSSQYLVLTDNIPFAQAAEDRVYLPGFPSLNDDGDAIIIKTAEGIRIDSLFYHDALWGPAEQGISLERKHPDSPSNDAANWALSSAANGHTAGIQNSAFQLDEMPPEILLARSQPGEQVFIVFSEFVQLDNAVFTLNGQTASLEYYREDNANIAVISGVNISDQEPIQLGITNISDFAGNHVNELSAEVAQPIEPGHIIINEIMYDPLANADDNLPDQTEYIELYNPGAYAISLEGVFLHDAPDENKEVRSISPKNTQYRWIPARGFAVIYADDEAQSFSDSKLAHYFELSGEDERFFLQVNRSSLSLASTGDAVYLADSSKTVIDSVFYDESWHNPNLYDNKGVSLERIDPAGAVNNAANWSSSTSVNGGTPGEQNSIFQQSGAIPEQQGITFTPNPFSPDDDGFEDHLFINYALNNPDYLLRVRIFDRYGRLVRTLADGYQAGFEGALIWDGLTDNRQKNRVGFYIILFEAYNSSAGKNVTFKKTVVLARKF